MFSRKLFLSISFFALLLVFTELLFRTVLCFFEYPFMQPSRHLEKKYYPFIENMEKKTAKRGGEERNILILGGSVVNTDWTGMEKRLDTLFREAYPNIRRFNFFNVAMPGHDSLDNLIKYRLLKDLDFDLVIYYEAINENRANNILPEMFSLDYSHIKWYDEINLLTNHPEMNFTVIPYVTHLLFKCLTDRLVHKQYISNDEVNPRYADFGKDIKTAKSYYSNINEIARLANQKHDPLLLVKYASYFPTGVKLTGEKIDKRYFSPCYFVSPVTTWGKPENVKLGISKHNAMLKKVHIEKKTYFFDMSVVLPKDSAMFCDVCHLSEKGAQTFARELSKYIISNKIIN